MQLILFRKCVDMFLNVFCSFVLLQAFPWIAFFSFVYWNCFLYNFFPLPRTIIYDVFFFQKISLSGTFTFDVMKSFQICPFQERLYSMPVLFRKFPCQELSHLLCFFFQICPVQEPSYLMWFLCSNFPFQELSHLMWILFRFSPFHGRTIIFDVILVQKLSFSGTFTFQVKSFQICSVSGRIAFDMFFFPFKELCKPELRSFLVFCCDATCACSPYTYVYIYSE